MDEDQKIIKEREITQDETEGGNLKVVTGNNEAVSHLIYAGSDIMLCLNFLQDQLLQVPLKALKYGTSPIELNPRTGHVGTHEQEAITANFINSIFGDISLVILYYLYARLDVCVCVMMQKKDGRLWKLKITKATKKDLCCDVHISAYTFFFGCKC